MLNKLRLPLVLLLTAGVLIAIGYWNIRPESFLAQPPVRIETPDDIDFYALGSRTVQFQEDGSRHYELVAERVEHVRSTDISRLSKPDLLLYRGSPHPWHVSSQHGEVAAGGAAVELIDQVRIERTDAKGRATVITTSRMTVLPDKHYAQTEQAVRIQAANGVTTATGMNAYLDDGRMLLLSNVRGQHELR